MAYSEILMQLEICKNIQFNRYTVVWYRHSWSNACGDQRSTIGRFDLGTKYYRGIYFGTCVFIRFGLIWNRLRS